MKNLTIKEIAQQASNLLGVDVLEDSFSLFSTTEEGGINWKSFLNITFEEIFKDIFNKNVVLDTNQSQLALMSSDTYYHYDISSLPIAKMLLVKGDNNLLFKVSTYSKLDKHSYLQKNTTIETSVFFENLIMEYLDSRIFLNVNNELTETMEADTDKVVIDNSLVIFKLCSLVANFKSLPIANIYQQKYMEQLVYIIQDELKNKKPLFL